jgi:tRNA1Val (adenine37-N6)-methyltransferase
MAAPLTNDTFFNGKLVVQQLRTGYRYSIDAIILAHQIKPRPGDRVLDLGTGCGIVPIISAFQFPDALFYGAEIQPELAAVAGANVAANHMEDRVQIMQQDLKTLEPNQFKAPMDLVVSNPPYRRASSGRINPNAQKAVARHEIKTTLEQVVAAAERMLKTAGRFIVIYSAERLTDLLPTLRAARIEPKYLRCIHSRKDTEAKLVLLEGIKLGNPGMKIAAPLVIYGDDGAYSKEVQAMFRL